MDDLGIIDLKKILPRNYEPFFLRQNPFPPIGIPSGTSLITADRELMIKRFQNIIAELRTNGTSIITVLVGDYGNGKSHLIKLFKQSVNDQLLSRDEGTLAVYVKTPGEDFSDFFLGLIEDIGRPLLVRYSEEVVRDFILKDKDEIIKKIFIDSKIKKGFLEDNFDLGALLENSSHLDLFQLIKEKKFKKLQSSDLLSAFLMLSHPSYSSKAWRWLIGERLGKDERESIGVETTISDAEKAYSAFKDLIVLLQLIGIKSVVIMLDELEKITLIHPSKQAKYQDQLRQMIDDLNKNVCMYFAIAPRQWNSLTKEPTALVRRLAGNWYVLERFKLEHTRELVEKYLYHNRTSNFSSKEAKTRFNDCEFSLCPFTTKSLENIHKNSEGVVSSILMLCRESLEYLCDHPNEFKSITPELVERIKK